MVGAAALVDGLAILGLAMRAGWLVGSLGVGALIAHRGSGEAYLAVAVAYLLGGLALLPARALAAASRSARPTRSGAASPASWPRCARTACCWC